MKIGQSGLTRAELEAACASLGRTIGKVVPPGAGFAFLLFDFGERGNMSYVSNAQRESMIEALHGLIAHLEGRRPS